MMQTKLIRRVFILAAPAAMAIHAAQGAATPVEGTTPSATSEQVEQTPRAATAAPLDALFREIPNDPYRENVLPPGVPSRTESPLVVRGVFQSVQVNIDAGGMNIVGDAANEPSIAVDPANPGRMAIGWRQFDTIASDFRQAGWAFTDDGGRTWTFPGVLEPGVFRSDPVLEADRDGNLYYMSLKVVGSNYNCYLFKSTDGGQTWGSPAFAFGGDKSWFAIDKRPGAGPRPMYQAWNIAGNQYFPNQFNRSFNGSTWSNPIEIPNQPVFGTVTIDPSGRVFVAGVPNSSFSTQFYVARSSTAIDPFFSPTFEQVVQVDMDGAVIVADGPNPAGLLGQVWIAADRSGGPNNGYVYLLSSVEPVPSTGDPMDVHFSRSTDGGLNWSTPVRINDDTPGNGAWQWFGTMSVAPNGRIDVIWNDTRNSGAANISELYYSSSTDGGVTWSANTALSPAFNSFLGWPNQNKLGDYYDMVSDNLGANVAYAATFNGEQDVYYLRIGPRLGDGDADDDHDLFDFAGFQDCFEEVGVSAACEPFDFNADDIVDATDHAAFTAMFTGPI